MIPKGISHIHLDGIFGGDPQPGLLVVELEDGRCYLEQEHGTAFDGFSVVFRRKIAPDMMPQLFGSEAKAIRRARELIERVYPGHSLAELDCMINDARVLDTSNFPTPPSSAPTLCFRWQAFSPDDNGDDLSYPCPDGSREPAAQELIHDISSMRFLYPELAHWGLRSLMEAWGKFETDVLLVGSCEPHRTDRFLGYIILFGIAGFDGDTLYGDFEYCERALMWYRGESGLPDEKLPAFPKPEVLLPPEEREKYTPEASAEDMRKLFPKLFEQTDDSGSNS